MNWFAEQQELLEEELAHAMHCRDNGDRVMMRRNARWAVERMRQIRVMQANLMPWAWPGRNGAELREPSPGLIKAVQRDEGYLLRYS